MNTRLSLALLVLVAPALPGCAELEPFLPKVHFDSLKIRDLSFQEADVDFVFRVDNPNPVKIGLSSFTYDLDLEDTSFINGDNEDGFRLEPEGSSDLVLPLDLVYSDIWDTIQATRGEDVVDFRLGGRMGFNTPAGEVKLPYDEEGDFPALRTPKFSFKALRVPRVDVFGGTADLEVDLGVINEHGSTLFFDRFDFGLDLQGQSVASGLVNTFDVAGDTEGVLTLPVTVNALNAVLAVGDALITGEKLDLGLQAVMDVDTPFGIVPLTIDETGALGIEGL
jgi:LEA14-like dessication related protein